MLTPRTATIMAFFIFVCLFGLSPVDGQVLHGRVLDAVSGEPISGANLMINETTVGTATASDGTYSIPFPHVPAVLVVSHLAYQTLKVNIDVATDEPLELSLEPATHVLDPVAITAHKVIDIMEGTSWEILDFEFLEDKLLLMANARGNIYKPCLLLVNLEGDTLASLKVSRAGEFYRDFGGDINFLTSQSALKVTFLNGQLHLEYLMDLDEFLSTYPVVIDVQDPYWMLQHYSMERLKLSYFRYNVQDSTFDLFCSISNQPAISRYSRGAYFDGTESDFYFASHIMNRPVQAPMFRVPDGYLIFNFVDNSIDFFSEEGTVGKKVNAGFMNNKQCTEQIYRDRSTGDFYVLYEKTGMSTLYLIDTNTGIAHLAAKIPGFVFVENIIIRDSEAFFLYKDKCREEQKKIFRMKL